MIPKVGNHVESSDLAVEFIKYDPDNEIENTSYENLLVLIRDKRVPGEYFKAGENTAISLKSTCIDPLTVML